MRPQLTDAYVKQQCLKMMGIKNKFPNSEKMFKSYSKLLNNSYSMTLPSQNAEMFYFDIFNTIINSEHLTKDLKHDFDFPKYETEEFFDSPSKFENAPLKSSRPNSVIDEDENENDEYINYIDNFEESALQLNLETPQQLKQLRGRNMERTPQKQDRNNRTRSPRDSNRQIGISDSAEIFIESIEESESHRRYPDRSREQRNIFSPSTNV